MSQSVPPFRFRRGRLPLLVSMPHVGTHIPTDILSTMTPVAADLADTDWHLEQLYDFLDELGASVLVATHSRYVIDLNRPEDNANLYPGQDTTGLCPLDTFAREPLYEAPQAPDAAEIERRRSAYWRPYHEQLQQELKRLREQHGIAMLWDAHSIKSVVPRFFEGTLPDFNIGTASGQSCSPELEATLSEIASKARGYTYAVNGRFKGGHITRHYGRPDQHIHAVQLELSEATYMQEEKPFSLREDLANAVRPSLRRFLEAMLAFAEQHRSR